jgi:membrane protease YdiL (CAAX protease family)
MERFVIGLFLCFVVVPFILKVTGFRSYLRAIGVVGWCADNWAAALGFVLSLFAVYLLFGKPWSEVWSALSPFSFEGAANWQAPVVEEILFRGVIYTLFLRAFGSTWAVVGSSVLFGIMHFFLGPVEVSILIVGSIALFALPRLITGSIWLSVVVHFVGNVALLSSADEYWLPPFIIVEILWLIQRHVLSKPIL